MCGLPGDDTKSLKSSNLDKDLITCQYDAEFSELFSSF